MWVAGFPGNGKPLRRIAQYGGLFPVNLEHPDQLAEIVATITDLRRHATAPCDIAVGLPPSALRLDGRHLVDGAVPVGGGCP
jgi:hypothetical protein